MATLHIILTGQYNYLSCPIRSFFIFNKKGFGDVALTQYYLMWQSILSILTIQKGYGFHSKTTTPMPQVISHLGIQGNTSMVLFLKTIQ
jgi:hypothetical protein